MTDDDCQRISNALNSNSTTTTTTTVNGQTAQHHNVANSNATKKSFFKSNLARPGPRPVLVLSSIHHPSAIGRPQGLTFACACAFKLSIIASSRRRPAEGERDTGYRGRGGLHVTERPAARQPACRRSHPCSSGLSSSSLPLAPRIL